MPYKNKATQRAYQNNWVKKRREAWLLENGPCAHCGATTRLEIDHINPDEKVTHRIWTWSAERRLGELAKCQVLCRECNQNKQTVLRTVVYRHGTAAFYQANNTDLRKRCRCIACRTAYAAYYRTYKQLKAHSSTG